LFSSIPSAVPEEIIETIIQCPEVSIERIVSKGHSSPSGFWYDQEKNELVFLLKGSAGLLFEGSTQQVVLNPGDYLNIQSHVKHRVEWTIEGEETVWLAVYY
jgi:cupin 2 domain-containing protein